MSSAIFLGADRGNRDLAAGGAGIVQSSGEGISGIPWSTWPIVVSGALAHPDWSEVMHATLAPPT